MCYCCECSYAHEAEAVIYYLKHGFTIERRKKHYRNECITNTKMFPNQATTGRPVSSMIHTHNQHRMYLFMWKYNMLTMALYTLPFLFHS